LSFEPLPLILLPKAETMADRFEQMSGPQTMPRSPRLLVSAALALALTGMSAPLAGETLTDALIRAYQTSPLLESNRAALRALDEAVPQARSARRPQIDATASINLDATTQDDPFFSDIVDTYAAGLRGSLLLYDFGATAAAVESARFTVAAGRASLLNVEQEVLLDAVAAYMDVLRDEEFVRLAENDVSVLNEQLDATRNRFEVGEVTRTDVSQTEARLASSRARLAVAVGNLEISRQAYAAVIGSRPIALALPPALPALPATLAEAEALALRQNPQIIAAQFNERAAIADFDRARAAKGPTISLDGSFQYEDRTSAAPAFDEALVGSIGIGARMPLSTGGRNDSLIRQAQSVLEQRKFQVQDAGRAAIEQVNAVWTQLDVARATLVANREGVVAAEIAFEGVFEEARLGARSTLDVLDADQERLQALAEVVRSRRDEYVATYAVLRAIGLLTVNHLGLGIDSYDPDLNYARVQRGPSGGFDTSAVDRIRGRWERQ
jgi:outer membrane protein